MFLCTRSFHFGFVPPLLATAQGFNSARCFLFVFADIHHCRSNPGGFAHGVSPPSHVLGIDEMIGAKQTT